MWNDNYGNYSFYLNISDSFEDETSNKNQDFLEELKRVKDQFKDKDFDGQVKQRYGTAVKSFFTFYMLSSTFIPISLYVTIELVKLWQAYFISEDVEMFSEVRDQFCRVNTSSLNEELGQVSYVFSDKTGTLTQNTMQFKLCKIGPYIYGDQSIIQFGDDPDEDKEEKDYEKKKCVNDYENRFIEELLFNEPMFLENECLDNRFYQKLKGGFTFDNQTSRVREFLKALSTAHQCLPEKKDSILSYHGPSPDEVALVEMA